MNAWTPGGVQFIAPFNQGNVWIPWSISASGRLFLDRIGLRYSVLHRHLSYCSKWRGRISAKPNGASVSKEGFYLDGRNGKETQVGGRYSKSKFCKTSVQNMFLTGRRLLYRTWHRSQTTCTTDESWTKYAAFSLFKLFNQSFTRYIILNRNGVANQLEASSRNFNPAAIIHDFKWDFSYILCWNAYSIFAGCRAI